MSKHFVTCRMHTKHEQQIVVLQCGAAQRAAVWNNAVSLDAVSVCMISVSVFVNVSLASFVCVRV